MSSFYHWPVERIGCFVGDLLSLDGVQMSRKPLVWEALGLFANGGIDFSDALIISEMRGADLNEIYSYDRDLDRVEDITRAEP